MELIDTHCHLGFDELCSDIDGVIRRSIEAGVVGWVNVGTDTEQNRKVVELAGRYEGMYASVGIHPHYAKDVRPEDIEQLRVFAENEKVVAIGETGLDYHYGYSDKDSQKRIFSSQLEVAAELKLPVIIHSREAFEDTMEILTEYGKGLEKVVFHCFGGDSRGAKVVLDAGYYISFTGVVTFKNAEKARQSAGVVPLERMMIETDCPYMSPAPMRKQRINEPALLVHTARFMADLKGIAIDEFCRVLSGVSRDFFCFDR